MAQQTTDPTPRGMDEHRKTYEAFLKGAIALSIHCGYILVALVAFRFMPSWNVFIGFMGLILGTIAILIDVRATGKWYVSGVGLVLFALIVAINVA